MLCFAKHAARVLLLSLINFECKSPLTFMLTHISDTEPLLKDSYSVSVVSTELSRKCGLSTDTVVTLSSSGVIVARAQLATFLQWKHIKDVRLADDDKNQTCVLSVDRLVFY